MMPSSHLTLCRPLLLLPSIFPSIRVFSNELALHIRWPKYWSFSFSMSPSNAYSELISFRIDWFDLFAVRRTLKNLLQHHSSKVSVLWLSTFFMVQLYPTAYQKSLYPEDNQGTVSAMRSDTHSWLKEQFETHEDLCQPNTFRVVCLQWQKNPKMSFSRFLLPLIIYFHFFKVYGSSVL